MGDTLQTTLHELSDIQRRAVQWDHGPLLVLAGPGSGKTRVLTCRVAQLLDQSRDRRFRVLALTFTNKAAHEMSSRVTKLVPGLDERADIHTFHSFCAQVLRQHGAHLGIRPDFAIFSRKSDRQAVLEDAIRREQQHLGHEFYRILPMIDTLKARMIGPEEVENRDHYSKELAQVYRLYENELRRANALDFSSLILEAYKLFNYPVMARHYQTIYRYWMVDEFQDTNDAQYKLIRRMAGENFDQIFAVADDDQTIYEWNGANVRRIRSLVEDFNCEVVQLPTNFRCPPRIVEAANRLLVYNVRRDQSKHPALPARPGNSTGIQQVQLRVFRTDADEAAGISHEIANLDDTERAQTLVLARTRALLEALHDAFNAEHISATLLMRRDDFVSPQLRWLVACLKQINRPLDRLNLTALVETFSDFTSESIDFEYLLARAQTKDLHYLSVWLDTVRQCARLSPFEELIEPIAALATGGLNPTSAINQVLQCFKENGPSEDLKDDLSAWRRLSGEIRTAVGPVPLDRFLQELELRSKKPVADPGAVRLSTIHGAKGLEFDTVYLIGLAEEVLPSWHSVRKGSDSAAIEEERRGCFVAITRTKKRLVLSRASRYRTWPKEPSRFLAEMGFTEAPSATVPGRGSPS